MNKLSATNYQKQQLKMYAIKFKDNISRERAENLIKKAKIKHADQLKYNMENNDLEGSDIFAHWNEDE